MDSIGKKILHGVFGAIAGLGLGFLIAHEFEINNHLLPLCIASTVLFAVLAFFFTDYFWETISKDF